MSNEIFDSWADDGKEVDPGELPLRLAELRDNFEPALPAKGEARRRRVEKMQKELAETAAFVEDCDRYAEQTRDVVLQGNEVRVMMGGYLSKLRRRAVDHGRQLNGELQFVKSQTQ